MSDFWGYEYCDYCKHIVVIQPIRTEDNTVCWLCSECDNVIREHKDEKNQQLP